MQQGKHIKHSIQSKFRCSQTEESYGPPKSGNKRADHTRLLIIYQKKLVLILRPCSHSSKIQL